MDTVKDMLEPVIEHFKNVTGLCYVEDEEKIAKQINEYFSSDSQYRSYSSKKFFMLWPLDILSVNDYIMFSDIRYDKSGWSIVFMVDKIHMVGVSLDDKSIQLPNNLLFFCNNIDKDFTELTKTDLDIFILEQSMLDNIVDV